MAIAFIVYGIPVAQGRPRATIAGGRILVYDPPASREYKRKVRLAALAHKPEQLLTGPLVLEVKVFCPIPKSFNRKKRELALSGQLRPTSRPDLKNYIAGIEDALEGVIYRNDSQIVSYANTGKWYGDPPRCEIKIYEIKKGKEKDA